MTHQAREKINHLLEETKKLGTKYAANGGVVSAVRRKLAAGALKNMGRERDKLRAAGEHKAANFYDNERRAYSAGMSKGKEYLENKKIIKQTVGDKKGFFDGFNKRVAVAESRKPRWLKSAKS